MLYKSFILILHKGHKLSPYLPFQHLIVFKPVKFHQKLGSFCPISLLFFYFPFLISFDIVLVFLFEFKEPLEVLETKDTAIVWTFIWWLFKIWVFICWAFGANKPEFGETRIFVSIEMHIPYVEMIHYLDSLFGLVFARGWEFITLQFTKFIHTRCNS